MQLQNDRCQDDSSDDELPSAEGEQEDGSEDDMTIIQPLRNRKRKRSESAEPEIAKRPRGTVESLVKRFEGKVVSPIVHRQACANSFDRRRDQGSSKLSLAKSNSRLCAAFSRVIYDTVCMACLPNLDNGAEIAYSQQH
jgi:hypothetical protein